MYRLQLGEKGVIYTFQRYLSKLLPKHVILVANKYISIRKVKYVLVRAVSKVARQHREQK